MINRYEYNNKCLNLLKNDYIKILQNYKYVNIINYNYFLYKLSELFNNYKDLRFGQCIIILDNYIIDEYFKKQYLIFKDDIHLLNNDYFGDFFNEEPNITYIRWFKKLNKNS